MCKIYNIEKVMDIIRPTIYSRTGVYLILKDLIDWISVVENLYEVDVPKLLDDLCSISTLPEYLNNRNTCLYQR